MAKSNESKTLAKPEPQPTAIAPPQPTAIAPLEKGGGGPPPLGRMACWQATPSEEKKYGADTGLKRGDFFDCLEIRKIGSVVKIVPVFAFRQWARFEKGSPIPVYVTSNKAEVPPADLEWSGDKANRTPPAATEIANVICVVEGEPWPYLFRFQRTSIKCWDDAILPLHNRHGYSLFELSTFDKDNASGQSYKQLRARWISKASAALLEQVNAISTQLDLGLKAAAEAKANEATAGEVKEDAPF